ncbi:helix-turn-helix transcriptional regulator [Gordonia sp. ABSL1-1]|uniref:PadR family transcriptional regulator n=1 Tax=Gordonia sp. ABSL1-1 TaxID=3053923 RepID=UPI0025742740|nr:helix-turn-helix transcriptional regulator [Gordonia sp. ABSL1-1]MDL9937053.1 helix-turn-helix transcriptional regulator [Gordonia sp. ABSL1-1]
MDTGAAPSGRESSRALPPIAVLVLGLLAERPMHCYEMFQTAMCRREDRLAKLRAGTLYHQVDRLAEKGHVEVAEVRREGNRPERTIYAITAQGRAALNASLELILRRHPQEYPELYLALSEAHGLPRTRVIELLGERIALMRADLLEYETAVDAVRAQGKPEMFYLDAGCRIITLRTQIDWLDDLVVRLTTSELVWLDDPGFLCSSAAPKDARADTTVLTTVPRPDPTSDVERKANPQ